MHVKLTKLDKFSGDSYTAFVLTTFSVVYHCSLDYMHKCILTHADVNLTRSIPIFDLARS